MTAAYTQVDPAEVGVSADYLANIDALQRRCLAENAYQGSVVLMARHGKVCYFKAFGKADEGVEMATDSIFRLASMTKVVAAVAVLQLFERGLIALHEPIATYLPAFADTKVAVVKDWAVTQLRTAERPITIHDLLTMTAGMTNTWWHGLFEPPIYHVVPKLYHEAGLVDDLNTPPTTLERNVELIASLPLIADPGTMFDYSNNSVDVLCRLVEVVSGQDFDSYLRDNIFTPLGMNEIWFFPPENQWHRIAAVFGPAATRTRPRPRRWGWACWARSTRSATTRPCSAARAACTAPPPTTSGSPRCCSTVASWTVCGCSALRRCG